MKARISSVVWTSLAMFLLGSTTALAGDFGAVTNGNWNNSATWTPASGPPGAADNAFIGSTYPGGAASTATVTLTADQSVANVYLGYQNGGGSGTLDLGSSTLTIAGTLDIGGGNGVGFLTRGTGSFTAQNLLVSNGNSLTLGTGDAVNFMSLDTGSSGTTAATGNVTVGAQVFAGSTLTLGADMNLSGSLDVEQNSTLNMGGHAVTANTIQLGYNNGQPTTLNRGGAGATLTAQNLFVGNQTLGLVAADSVTNLYLANASATTAAVGNVTGSAQVFGGSTLTLGADMNLTGFLDVEQNSTLNMGGHAVTANAIGL
ncbi:MAG TPA: hypothetical protein VG013_07015, partial [Gemmataceae bacterium]|nr:hypothetical protein [Gemmataceae bacterium]